MVDKKKGLKGKGVKKNKAHVDSGNEGNRFTPIEQGTLEKMRNGANKFYDTVAVKAMDRFDTKQGKTYKKEKMKVKRGSAGQIGTISQHVNSVKFLEGGGDDDGDRNDNDQQGGAASNTARSGQKTGGGEPPGATKGSAQPKKGPTRIVFSD